MKYERFYEPPPPEPRGIFWSIYAPLLLFTVLAAIALNLYIQGFFGAMPVTEQWFQAHWDLLRSPPL